jgi:hypothetical protein
MAVITGTPRSTPAPAAGSAEHKLTVLVSEATRDLSALVRDEVALAKAETKRDVKEAATGGGLFGAAALLGVFTLVMISFAAAYGLHDTGLGLAWAWLVVAAAYLAAAGLCMAVGMVRLKRIRAGQATRRSAGQSLAVLRRSGR